MKSAKPTEVESEPANPPDDTAPQEGERRGRNAEAYFCGQRCSNWPHASTTDPDARFYCNSADVCTVVPSGSGTPSPINPAGCGWPGAGLTLMGSAARVPVRLVAIPALRPD